MPTTPPLTHLHRALIAWQGEPLRNSATTRPKGNWAEITRGDDCIFLCILKNTNGYVYDFGGSPSPPYYGWALTLTVFNTYTGATLFTKNTLNHNPTGLEQPDFGEIGFIIDGPTTAALPNKKHTTRYQITATGNTPALAGQSFIVTHGTLIIHPNL